MYRQQADFFKGIGNPRRIKLIKLLMSNGQTTVSDLAKAFEEDPSTVSRYLTHLRMLGILETERKGQTKYYWVDEEKLEASFQNFLDFLKQPDEQVEAFLEKISQKVS